MVKAWNRQGSGRQVVGDTSSRDNPGGFRAKMDPTLPTSHQAIVGPDGKRAGVLKKKGAKYTHSGDNHSQEHPSAGAAVRSFADAKSKDKKKVPAK